MKSKKWGRYNTKLTVIVSPGSNCDADMLWTVRGIVGADVGFVRYNKPSLEGFDRVLLPGGFSCGDYLRCDAIARFSTIMEGVIRFAEEGKPVFGTYDGFQILTEVRSLPGVLRRNKSSHFTCKTVSLKVNPKTASTSEYEAGKMIYLPAAHGEGGYSCDEEALQKPEKSNQIAFTYSDNINGSVENIAGITNKAGNVSGTIPHPERTVEGLLGSEDGKRFFASVLKNLGKVAV